MTLSETAASADTSQALEDAPIKVIVLGATGSIGQSLADLIARSPEKYDVVALVANKNAAALADMAIRLGAKSAVLADQTGYTELRKHLNGRGIAVAAGQQAVMEAVDLHADLVVGAIVGAAGLAPTLAAIRPGRRIALANKECLVCAGDLFMDRIAETGAELLPVDSEHNAIFQVFDQAQANQIEKVILTASGGPFRTFSLGDMRQVTPAQALKHPNWDMGARITIDSATMLNKGLEIIEAFHLFPIEINQLDVLVHPQSAVHGLVQYADGSLLAQLGSPDMRTPIAHCLAYPKRMVAPVERLDLAALGTLSFEKPDLVRFPALRLAWDALRAGGLAPTVLNAADEVAVEAFLAGKIGFLDIPAAIEAALEDFEKRGLVKPTRDIGEVLSLDEDVRMWVREWTTNC